MLKNSMKTKSVLSTSLMILFCVLGFILILSVFIGVPFLFKNINDTTLVLNWIVIFGMGVTYFIMIIFLTDIVCSSKKNIFLKSNVKKFKKIGYLLFANLVFDYTLMICNGMHGTRLLDLFPGIFITPGMAIYFISGLLCFVIADAFDQAIKIKEDNDLTI